MSPAAAPLLGALVLPAVTLALWLVRAVGSVRRRDGHYLLVPVLCLPFVALALLVVPSLVRVERDPVAHPWSPVGWPTVVQADGLLTLLLLVGIAVLELPLWAARAAARRRHAVA